MIQTVRARLGACLITAGKIAAALLVSTVAIATTPASAMVGGAAAPDEAVGRAVVTIVGSRGNFCSGTLIAPTLVLSAAHCVSPGASYKIVLYGDGAPQLRAVTRVADHPKFDAQGIAAHRASADVALLLLSEPLPGKAALPLGAPLEPIAAEQRFTVAGAGVAARGDGKSGGTVRAAELVSTSHPGRLQIRLMDPAAANTRAGLGACTGDSGGPALQAQDGRTKVIGVVSWSTAPLNAAGCGGLTGVTPLTLYRDWIVQTARTWGVAL